MNAGLGSVWNMKGFPTVESEQVVSGTFPCDLHKGKKRKVSSHTVVIKVGWFL